MLPQHNDRKLSATMLMGIYFFLGGLGLSLLGLILPFAFTIGILCTFIGVLVVGWSVFSGLNATARASRGDYKVVLEESKVVARFAVNEVGETIFSSTDIDFGDPDFKLYVRIATPDGRRWELRTLSPIWLTAGEGMRGRSVVEGDWLSQFAPFAGIPAAPDARPYG